MVQTIYPVVSLSGDEDWLITSHLSTPLKMTENKKGKRGRLP